MTSNLFLGLASKNSRTSPIAESIFSMGSHVSSSGVYPVQRINTWRVCGLASIILSTKKICSPRLFATVLYSSDLFGMFFRV